MNKPPDLHDPGAIMVPPAENFITLSTHSIVVHENSTGMDTDSSAKNSSKCDRKRSYKSKICKHCNKKKRKNAKAVDGKVGCVCVDSEGNSDQCSSDKGKHLSLSAPLASPNCDASPPSNVQTTSSYVPVPPAVTTIARNLYQPTDKTPYIVHVQREIVSPNDGTTFHPVTFGKFLKRNNFQNIIDGSLKKIGRNKIELAFKHFSDANSFISSEFLSVSKLKAYIPSFNVTRMGLVRNVPSEWSPEEVIENMTLPDGCGKVLKVRRLNFKVIVDGSPVWKPTQSVVVTFDGQILPKRVFICYNSLPVELYTYPTIQCYNCCRYGHTKGQCRAKPRCYKCGQDHTGDNCSCTDADLSCCNCQGSHFATNKTLCPEFARQKQIKVSMSQNNISYGEAAKLIPPVSRSYADVVNSTVKNIQSGQTQNATSKSPYTERPPLQSSYRKTVFANRRVPPKPSMGYDRIAHQKIVNDYNMPAPPNGCGFSNNITNMTSVDMIQQLIIPLLQFQSQLNVPLPPNAAAIIDIFNNQNAAPNGTVSESGSMEL